MEQLSCPACGIDLPERGVFCPGCATHIRCKACRALLEPNAHACVECGISVEESAPPTSVDFLRLANPSGNVIRFEETKTHRSLEARFTDAAVDRLSDPLAAFFTSGLRQPVRPKLVSDFRQPLSPATGVDGNSDIIDSEGSIIDVAPLPIQAGDDRLLRVFSNDGQHLRLIEPRLKPTSRKNFVERLSCLFLYGHDHLGRTQVPRTTLNDLLKHARVYDSNAITQISNSANFVHLDGGIGLSALGLENAKKYLDEVFDTNIQGTWELSSATKSKARRSQKAAIDTDDSTQKKTVSPRNLRKSSKVEEWTRIWKDKHGDIPAHEILSGASIEHRGVFGLWAIGTLSDGTQPEVSRGLLAKFIHSAFDLVVNDRTLQTQLTKSKLVVTAGGTKFRITPAGTKFVEELVATTAN